MTSFIVTNFYIFILGIVLAILEIQIEGPYGWAKNLPTWRPQGNNWLIRCYTKFMSGREATGYHAAMFTFVLLVLHLPYVFGYHLNVINWSMTISLFFIFIILWDFLWFVLNPYHPLKKFSAEHIWWHKKWWGRVPRDYYLSILLSLMVLLPAILIYQKNGLFYWWLNNMFLFIIEVALTIWFTLIVLKIDNWKK